MSWKDADGTVPADTPRSPSGSRSMFWAHSSFCRTQLPVLLTPRVCPPALAHGQILPCVSQEPRQVRAHSERRGFCPGMLGAARAQSALKLQKASGRDHSCLILPVWAAAHRGSAGAPGCAETLGCLPQAWRVCPRPGASGGRRGGGVPFSRDTHRVCRPGSELGLLCFISDVIGCDMRGKRFRLQKHSLAPPTRRCFPSMPFCCLLGLKMGLPRMHLCPADVPGGLPRCPLVLSDVLWKAPEEHACLPGRCTGPL